MIKGLPAAARLALLLLLSAENNKALAFVHPSTVRTPTGDRRYFASTSTTCCHMRQQQQQEPKGVGSSVSPQETASKIAITSLLSAALLLAPMAPPSVAATTTAAATTSNELPASFVLPKKAVATSKAAPTPAVPKEKLQIEVASKALKDAGANVVAANKDLVAAKLVSEKACLAVDQLQSKNKAAKEELSKLQAAKPSSTTERKIGTCAA